VPHCNNIRVCTAGENNSERVSVDIWTSISMLSGANNVHNHSPFSDLSAISSSEPTLLHRNNKNDVLEEELSSRPIVAARGADDCAALSSAERNERNACKSGSIWQGVQSGGMSGSSEGRASEEEHAAAGWQGKRDCHSQPQGWVSGAFDELVSMYPHRRAVVSKLNLLRNREDAIVSRYNQ
jgi:hypothetical protein